MRFIPSPSRSGDTAGSGISLRKLANGLRASRAPRQAAVHIRWANAESRSERVATRECRLAREIGHRVADAFLLLRHHRLIRKHPAEAAD